MYDVPLGVSSRWDGQAAASLLNFLWVCLSKWEQVFFCVGYRFEEFGLVLCSDQLNVLLKSEHEFEIALFSN